MANEEKLIEDEKCFFFHHEEEEEEELSCQLVLMISHFHNRAQSWGEGIQNTSYKTLRNR
jgi:hypothetical protein